MSVTALTILAGIWLLSALVSGAIASGRDRDGAIWMAVGLIIGPLAILPPLIFAKPA